MTILFAFYKNNNFIGWRQDTFGTIGKDGAKIYPYTEDQVKTVLNNISKNLDGPSSFGKLLGVKIIEEAENKIYEEISKNQAFEVRVIKGPTEIYEENFNVKTARYEKDRFPTYNSEELQNIVQNPDDQEVLETHYFSLSGKLSQN